MSVFGLRDDVQRYLSHGFRPIPMWGVDGSGHCLCGGLLPNGKPCRAGKHSAEPIETEWKERRYGPEDFQEGQNVALALGPWSPRYDGADPSRWLVCFDYDGLPADYEGTPFFSLPPTLTQKSPRGRHLFFTVPAFEPLGNWNDVFGTRHDDGVALDIRYARGRINAAPSRTAFGEYRWLDWRKPAPLPPEVSERIYDHRRARGLPVMPSWDRGEKRAG